MCLEENICFQCEQKDIILESGVCANCDYMNRKNDYLQNDGTITITKDNIHLYYEFFNDEDLESQIELFDNVMYNRLFLATQILKVDNFHNHLKKLFSKNSYPSYFGYLLFGIKDTLKPIDEYIAEIKESSEYKEYIQYDKLKTNLNWYDISIIQSLEDDYDSSGDLILRYDCKKDNKSVTVELYQDNEVDIFYTQNDETIYRGALKN